MGIETNGKKYTFEEFCFLIKDDEKADLIDGVIYMSSPENTDANTLFGWLFRLIGDFVEEYELGEVYGSRVAFRLGESHGPEPDIAFVRTERLHIVQRGFVEGPPDLAIEIVSPDSVERDYVRKREQYRQAGVKEYWIVDEMEQRVVLLKRSASGAYREIKSRKGVLHSQVLTGFWLRPEWLWQEPRPKKKKVLAEILKA
ncbi:MAG TPA: Uma2 family endonuclease [Gemmataceae bacterium]|nr:Uma2 family endonuclease [Gemmataceae bacterium]